MTESKRLREVRQYYGYTQTTFAEKLKLKQGSYSDVERGKVGVSSQTLKTLILEFNINPIWLLDGNGDMFISQLNISNCNHNIKDYDELVSAYKKTIQVQQEYIKDLKVQLHSFELVR